MPKKVMPSESSIIVNYEVHTFDGKFYVEEKEFKKLHEKFVAAKNTISYTIDKWFLSIENRMKDQDRVMTATARYERAANKISQLEKELRELKGTVRTLKMGAAKPAFEKPQPGETPEEFNDRTGRYNFEK